jgi:hypothetical protein
MGGAIHRSGKYWIVINKDNEPRLLLINSFLFSQTSKLLILMQMDLNSGKSYSGK